ncbi:hypothetical protein [uncultured Erythrobacter sp.]|uniref:hypothetical protein n=1 Tax=uncultured Erythrobacter sp. TaxID=263913 RepID=UPI00262E5E44|nr:hypothetical protein [uncultured Erythrobacter sp.]
MIDVLDLFFQFLVYTSHFRGELQDVWTVALMFACLRWGGGPEKIGFAVWTVLTFSSTVVRALYDGPTAGEAELAAALWTVQPIDLLTDVLLFVGFVAIALVANRRYIFWVAAFQVIALSAHLLRALIEGMTPFTYVFMTVAPGWAQVFIFTYGLIAHTRREPNRYADWRWQVKTA